MTMTANTPSSMSAEPARVPWLRIGLIVLAGLILLGALLEFPGVFFDHGHTDRLLILAQRLTGVKLALAPLIAGAALFFAIRGKLPSAIVALATLMLVNWLDELPGIAIHGMELTGNSSYLFVIAAQKILYPILAIASISLALRNDRLATAAALTAIPTIVNCLGVVVFAIGVMIYGF